MESRRNELELADRGAQNSSEDEVDEVEAEAEAEAEAGDELETLPHLEPVSWESLGTLEPMNVATAASSGSGANRSAALSATAFDGVRSLIGWWNSPQGDNRSYKDSRASSLGSSKAIRSASPSSSGRAVLTAVMLMLLLAVAALGLGVEVDSLGVLTQAWVVAGSWLHGQSRLRRLVSIASARARRSGALQPLPLASNGLEEVHDDPTGVYFLVNHMAKSPLPALSSKKKSPSSTFPQSSAGSTLNSGPGTSSAGRSHDAWFDPSQDPLSLTARERDLEVCGPTRGDACVLRPQRYSSSSSGSSRLGIGSSSESVEGRLGLGSSEEEEEAEAVEAFQGWSVVLNKFAGLQDHVLLVTDEFREQSDPLSGNDLAALATLVVELPGVGFFNSGYNAGASQRHRHLQAVPLDVFEKLTLQAADHARGGRPSGVWAAWHHFWHGADHPQGVFAAPPIAQVLEKYVKEMSVGDVDIIPELPFRHAFVSLDLRNPSSRRPQALGALFAGMASTCGLNLRSNSGSDSAAYNFMLAPTWALLVPRSQRVFAPPDTREGHGVAAVAVDVNALGFLGCFLVPEPGANLPAAPSEILASVAFPRQLQ